MNSTAGPQPTHDLPDIVLRDGNAISVDVAEPCLLYAWTTTDLGEGGRSSLSVYRSTWIKDNNHPWLDPVRHLISDDALLHREIVEDDQMVFGHGELSIYRIDRGRYLRHSGLSHSRL